MTAASESEYPSRTGTDLCGERQSNNLPHHRLVDLASDERRSAVHSVLEFRTMHERIRFISHQGKQILFVDLSNCSADEVQTIARTVPDYVTTQPRGSVLILTDFAGASFDR